MLRWMQIACLVLALILTGVLSGCERKPPAFDQRYEQARQKLEVSATMIDREIAASDSASDAEETATGDAQSSDSR